MMNGPYLEKKTQACFLITRRCNTSGARRYTGHVTASGPTPTRTFTLWSLTREATGKCSDLRGSEQPAAFQEGIETSSPPGAKEGCQGHLAVGALP